MFGDGFWLGMFFTLAGASINSVGILLQKLEIDRMQDADDDRDESIPLKRFLKRPLWVAGILMQTVILIPFFFIGIDLLGVTLAQPVATAGILVFVVGSVWILKEHLSPKEWIGVIAVFTSIILISLGGITGDVEITLFLEEGFMIRLLVFLIPVGALVAVGAFLAIGDVSHRHFGHAILFGLSYAWVSISGQVTGPVLDAMFGGEKIPGTTPGLPALILFIGLFGVIIGTMLGIIFSQAAFKTAAALHAVPTSQAVNNVIPILAGVYIFYQRITIPSIFIAGIACLLVGVTLLARFQAQGS
ncbi:EamA family transporter [Candidatus Bathyarchaeota archaeon]|nr:EamA family transporter [Candidatus Bathyarchaeota archaeon]